MGAVVDEDFVQVAEIEEAGGVLGDPRDLLVAAVVARGERIDERQADFAVDGGRRGARKVGEQRTDEEETDGKGGPRRHGHGQGSGENAG